MSKTRVVNMLYTECDVYVGRAGKGRDGYFGNPFRVEGNRATSIEKYRSYFIERVRVDPEFKRRVLALRGKTLGCFCAPLPCHANIIADWLEAQPAVQEVRA